MCRAIQQRPCQIGRRNLVSHREPRCRPTSWMTGDVRPILASSEVQSHRYRRKWLDWEIQRIGNRQGPVGNGDAWFAAAEGHSLKSRWENRADSQ